MGQLSNTPSISSGSLNAFTLDWPTFVDIVVRITVQAYKNMRQDKVAQIDWEEDRFSQYLGDKIRPLAFEKNIFINIRTRYYTEEIRRGLKSTKKAQELDMALFGSWERNYNENAFVWECKRIVDKTIDQNKTGLVLEYIKEGMKRFIDNEYSQRVDSAGMIGYVLCGDPIEIIKDINERMKNQNLSVSDNIYFNQNIENIDTYISNHSRSPEGSKINIHHLLFSFDFI